MAQSEANMRRQQDGTTTTTPTTTTLTTGPDGDLEPSTIPSATCCCWWFIDNNKGGRQHLRGPYTVSQMGVLFDVGTLTDITQVWKAPDGEWRALKQAKDLIQDMDTQVADDKIQEEEKQGEQQQQQRLPLDKIPSTEIRQCTSCITAQREGYCDLTYFWDRPNKMWLLWDEYEVLCRNTGITEGLITNNRILRGGRDIISTTGIQSNHDPTRQQQQQQKKNKDAAGAGAAIYVPLDDPEKEAKRKKRREYRARKKLKQQAGLWKARVKEENNPSIYISGLPDDSTVEELYDLFKLAGAIKRDLETGHYKIKIYGLNDDDDNNNSNGSSWGMEEEEGEKKRVPTSSSSSSSHRTGDALISYQSVESVPIAIDRYDDYKLREDCRIHVARASFDHYGDSTVKRDKVDNTPDDDVANHLDNDTLKLMASRNNKRRVKLLELRRKEVEAAASWEDDQAGRDRAWKPIIVLKGMYTVQEANSDHAEETYSAIKQDVQSEMCKFGEVKKVVVIEDSLDAYVCIKFKTMDEAQNAAAHLASNNLTIPTTSSSTAAVDRKASDMFFHDGRDLKSRPIIPPPTPSNNSVAGSSSNDNTTSIYDDINTVTTDDKATEREKDWERFLEGDDDSSDDEFIIHEEEGEEDTLHPPE